LWEVRGGLIDERERERDEGQSKAVATLVAGWRERIYNIRGVLKWALAKKQSGAY